MTKNFTLLLAMLFFSSFQANAQLADGSIVPDFTATDIEGNTWNLYDVLDEGKTVIIDVSATWCEPCWAYHQTGALENLYEQYGPEGTNEMMVFMIEADAATNTACLYNESDCVGGTTGDWVTGTKYPIIDNAAIGTALEVTAFPTIFHVCSNRVLTNAGRLIPAEFYALNNNCLPAAGSNNAAILYSDGFEGKFCETKTFTPSISAQNMGTGIITSANVQLTLNGVVTQTMDWTGELNTFQIANIVFDEITITADATYQIEIISVNGMSDDDATNNLVVSTAELSLTTNDNYVTIEIQTDQFSPETYWELLDDNGNALYSGGNAVVVGGTSNAGAYTPNSFNQLQAALPSDGCYEFKIYDVYGDGICCTNGSGFFKLKDSAGNIIAEGGSFAYEAYEPFKLESGILIENNASLVGYSGETGINCSGYSFSPQVTIQNLGANEITSVAIDVNNSAGLVYTYDWTGNIASGGYGFITLDPITIDNETTISYQISEINGEPDNLDYQNSLTSDFEEYSTTSNTITIELQLDGFGYETYWQFTNSAGDVLASGGNELVGVDGGGLQIATTNDPGAYVANQLVIEEITLNSNAMDCYNLLIVDDYGDGFFVQNSTSYLKFIDGNGEEFINLDLATTFFEDNSTPFIGNTLSTSVAELEEVNNLIVFPNPASDRLMVQFGLTESMPLTLTIFNTLGQPVQTISNRDFGMGNQSVEANVADLANGVYYVSLANGERQMTQKFTIIR